MATSGNLPVSAEWCSIVERMPVLVDSITSNVDHIANVLYSKQLLSQAEYHSVVFVTGIESSPASKAQRIVVAVETKVKVDPRLFAQFIAILQEQHDDLVKQCAERIMDCYQKKLRIGKCSTSLQDSRENIGFCCPYCSQCSIEEFFKGCSKATPSKTTTAKPFTLSFPFLDTKHLTRKEEILLYDKLCSDFGQITDAFYELCMKLSESKPLSAKREDIKTFLMISCCMNGKDRERMINSTTIRDVLTSLCLKHTSFYNYEIIKQIVKKFGSGDDKAYLEQYLEEFRRYCSRCVFEVPTSVLHPCQTAENSDAQFALKYLEEGHFDLNQVKSICIRVAGILRINPWDLYLVNIEKGCILLRMMMPKVIAERVLPIALAEQMQLQKIGLVVAGTVDKDVGPAILSQIAGHKEGKDNDYVDMTRDSGIFSSGESVSEEWLRHIATLPIASGHCEEELLRNYHLLVSKAITKSDAPSAPPLPPRPYPKPEGVEKPHLKKSTWLCKIDRSGAQELLRDKVNGTFLCRPATNTQTLKDGRVHTHSIDVMCNGIQHVRVLQYQNGKVGICTVIVFNSLEELILYYSEHSLEQHNARITTTLKYPLFTSIVLSD